MDTVNSSSNIFLHNIKCRQGHILKCKKNLQLFYNHLFRRNISRTEVADLDLLYVGTMCNFMNFVEKNPVPRNRMKFHFSFVIVETAADENKIYNRLNAKMLYQISSTYICDS
jgi:hypothetical protein